MFAIHSVLKENYETAWPKSTLLPSCHLSDTMFSAGQVPYGGYSGFAAQLPAYPQARPDRTEQRLQKLEASAEKHGEHIKDLQHVVVKVCDRLSACEIKKRKLEDLQAQVEAIQKMQKRNSSASTTASASVCLVSDSEEEDQMAGGKQMAVEKPDDEGRQWRSTIRHYQMQPQAQSGVEGWQSQRMATKAEPPVEGTDPMNSRW